MPIAADITLPGSESPTRGVKLGFVFTASLALVAFADYLFFGHRIGWTAALFAIAFLIAAAAHEPERVRSRRGKLLFVFLMGLALSFAESPGLLALALLALFLPAFLLEHGGRTGRPAQSWLLVSIFLPLALLFAVIEDMGQIHKMRRASQEKRGSPIFLNLLVPLAFAAVFVALFSLANPIFERYLDAIKFSWRPDLARTAFWAVVFAISWGLFRLYRTPLFTNDPISPAAFAEDQPIFSKLADTIFSPSIVFRSLILFNILFLLQNGLDIAFLWSGAALPDGVTYAEYAHRGAYPLIATALLAGAFVLIALRPGGAPKLHGATRILIALWLIQNVFLVLSSILRTNAYVAEYSLAYLRIYAFIWMGLVAWGLILIAARLVLNRPNAWLVRANMVSLLAVLFVACFLDFGGIIAAYNVAHCQEVTGKGPRLDYAYLYNIGPSSLPALREYQNKVGNSTISAITPEHQRNLYSELWADNGWRAWTYRTHRLRQIAGREPPGDGNSSSGNLAPNPS